MCAKMVGSGLQAQQRGQALMCNCFSDAMSAAIPRKPHDQVKYPCGKGLPKDINSEGNYGDHVAKNLEKKICI